MKKAEITNELKTFLKKEGKPSDWDESRIDAIGQNGGDGEHYEQLVTRQLEWEIQACNNNLGAYNTLMTFKNEEEALEAFSHCGFRLVQKALIDIGSK